jgi:microcystin degradation protein MlrC
MRIVIALFQHETNTFSPIETPYTAFVGTTGLSEPPEGQHAIEVFGQAKFAFSAFVDLATAEGAEVDVPIAAYAEPSGPVFDDAFDTVAESICAAVARGCDGVMLDLHGAMVTQSHSDGEGELLRRIRAVDPNVPIAVALDFHANMSDAIVDNADVVTGYCTYPHVDMYATGERAGKTLLRKLRGECDPVTRMRRAPMLTHMLLQTPSREPMKSIMGRAMSAESTGEVLNASVFGGFPLADIPEACLSAIVVEERGSATADSLMQELISAAWRRRADFVWQCKSVEAGVSAAASLTDGPVVVADHGDNTGAGGPSDNVEVLREMLRQGLDNIVTAPLWDPEALEQCLAAGLGASLEVEIGGKTDSPAIRLAGKPLRVTGTVEQITDGVFTITCPMQTGFRVCLGPTVVFNTGQAQILINAHRTEPFDIGCITHAGIDLADKHYVLVKSRQHFRAGFEAIAKHIILVDGPGVCGSDYSQFSFANLSRPIYPLDIDMEFDA